MNYLAHFHLASADEGLIIGALLGDFVKGPLRGEYPPGWERGIRLHRRIDAWTDGHAQVKALLRRLPEGYRRYGGIMFDVCFDHYLSQRWDDLYHQPLEGFSSSVYRKLEAAQGRFPVAARRQASRLAQHDVLTGMRDWELVEKMLAGIGRRLQRDNPLAHSAAILQPLRPEIDAAFAAMYPELMRASAQWLREI